MGRDKAFVTLAGKALVAHALERLAPQVGPVAISANGEAAAFAAFGCPVVADADPAASLGPLAGVLAGLRWAGSVGASRLATVPVDCPFLPPGWVATLGRAAGEGGIAVAGADDGLHPAVAIWPVAAAGALETAIAGGARRLGETAVALGAVVVRAGASADFANINTPEDLAAADAAIVANRR